MRGQGATVVVVGGGNSAGQAAIFLARYAQRVCLVIRKGDLGADISRGDVRSGSTKRVASAVGEGAMTVHFVHRILNG